MSGQLALGVGLRDSATFDNFVPGDNGAALHALRAEAEPFLYLWGTPGCGRSHLLQAACHACARQGGAPVYLPLAELAMETPEMLEGLESLPLVCLDDLDRVAGDAAWEPELFHLYNRIREAGGRLLVAAATSPAAGWQLPDLQSRLTWGPVFHLSPLSDGGKIRALQLRARDRGLELSDEVGNYLLRHAPRDTRALFELLDRLDEASLAAQRRLTIPFVRQVIERPPAR